ncbi:SURF1 family protein [Lapillicoccus jejuensis]|uniref:SURF1-like protein n=1 Tax=Lapillicoccus jejuensis TaxID=402171 RepID=A0A542E4D2_9MICO|nr:SURF1 family protein [Lapillicoccus jejuensis]TQJ10191.1 cytochrome oxidase assembly protein ShyY1 [Lapillicoccus jejuensis]
MVRTLVSPRWLLGLLVAVLFAVACVFLGRWQWGKYEDKQTRATTVHTHYAATPVPLAAVAGRLPPTATTEWTRVTATGSYDVAPVLYVRNRALSDNPGFELLSAFTTSVDGRPLRLLVDRGWVASGDTAADLPTAPPPPTGTVTVQGWLRRTEPSLGKDLPRDQLASIALPDAQRSLGGADLAPTYLQLESERTPAGATPPRPTPLEAPDTDLGPNQAYAFQWWLFSVFGFVFYGYRIRLWRQERDALAAEGAPVKVATGERELVPAAAPRKPRKVRIWDEEDG